MVRLRSGRGGRGGRGGSRLWPRSLLARTTVAAALAAAVVFAVGALWMRHVVYAQRMDSAAADARQEAQLIIANTTPSSWPSGNGWGGFPYELLAPSGVLGESTDVYAVETGRTVKAGAVAPPLILCGPAGTSPSIRCAGDRTVMPLPGYGSVIEIFQPSRVTFTSRTAGGAGPLVGLTVTAVDETTRADDLAVHPDSGFSKFGRADALIRVYVFITPFAAQAQVAALDRVLYPAVPICVLLVAAVAYLATRRALRPVEAIRARTAAVTATDPRERVEVPDTGDGIARLAATINDTLQRLDDAASAQRRFVADAAHELRSPLTTLLANLEVAAAYPDRADWPATVATATAQTRRIQSLAEDLLLLARLDATAPMSAGTVDLAALAAGLVNQYPNDPDAPTVTCRVADPVPAAVPVPVQVPGVPGQLERLLRNLLDNAVRHAGQRVEVEVSTCGGAAVVTVTDDGPGIPAHERHRVFDRFTRLDEARARDTGGAGLGLAIAREIATRHRGTIDVTDAAPGARFTVRLPLEH